MTDGLPAGVDEFLEEAGWGAARVEPLPGDASFRRYFRVRKDGASAMLMDAPPPHEDPGPFLHVGKWLCAQGLRAPAIYAERPERGLVLIEDFGADRMRDWLDGNPHAEEETYARAIDALVELHRRPPGPFAPYDMAVYQREAGLFAEWYCPAMKLAVDEAGWRVAWDAALAPMLPRQEPGVTVLRDYHAENIMLLADGDQGLIDFQDALVGHPAYDLVSLLQDARVDVPDPLEISLLGRYVKARLGADPDFATTGFVQLYVTLGAQRATKILGIFARLDRRDGKPQYLRHIQRIWRYLRRSLIHPALDDLKAWYDTNVPPPPQ